MRWTGKMQRFEGPDGFEGLDAQRTVKTLGFEGLDVRWIVKTHGFVDPSEGGGGDNVILRAWMCVGPLKHVILRARTSVKTRSFEGLDVRWTGKMRRLEGPDGLEGLDA